MQEFYSHGKLLISGEYLVLAGAKALAVPLKLGQKMKVSGTVDNSINWNAYYQGNIWFSAQFSLHDINILNASDVERASYVQQLLLQIKKLSPIHDFSEPLLFEHELEFNPFWGLGSSSSLINNLAQWAKIDAFELLTAISKGSGYDLACAIADSPIFFQKNENQRIIQEAPFFPEFHELLHFVYLGKKQDTEKSVQTFLNKPTTYKNEIHEISQITHELCMIKDLKDFVHLIELHEKIIASVIGLPRIKEKAFPNYSGCIKSLGAWGGDFVLTINAQNDKNDQQYFQQKGYPVYLNYKDLVL